MNFFRFFIFALGLATPVLCSRHCPPRTHYPTFNGNVSIDGLDVSYSYRASDAFTFSRLGDGGIGVYSSVAAFKDSHERDFDLYAARLTADSFRPPTASTAWFSSSSSYSFNSSASDGEGQGTGYAGLFSSAMATVFLEAVEYFDVDNDGLFDPKVDITIQTIPLRRQKWDTMCDSISKDSPLVSFNITTLLPCDDHWARRPAYLNFSIQATLSEVTGVTSNNVLLTPRSMKIDLELNDFPYIGYNYTSNNTRLALGTVVAAAQANASATISYDGRRIRSGDGDAQFSLNWDNRANVDGRDATVRSGGYVDYAEVAGELGLALDIFFSAQLSASVSLKKIYFSFDGVQPSNVYWDPMITSGPVLSEAQEFSSSVDVAAIVCGVLFGLFALLLFAYAVYRLYSNNGKLMASLCCCINKESKAETAKLVDNNNSDYSKVNDI